MSYLHSESQNARLELTIRVKILNLTGSQASLEHTAAECVVDEPLGALITQGARKIKRRIGADYDFPSEMGLERTRDPGELCSKTGERLATGTYEEHIERCSVCASRVELQLDFMDCLEAAIYQAHEDVDAEKVCGALIVSAPEKNFAICGEIDFGSSGSGADYVD